MVAFFYIFYILIKSMLLLTNYIYITDVLLGIIIEDAVRLDPQKVGSNRSNSVKEEFQDSKGLI
jgi:hypothetical protein